MLSKRFYGAPQAIGLAALGLGKEGTDSVLKFAGKAGLA